MTSEGKPHFYAEHARDLKRDLAAEIPGESLRVLHRRTAWKHFTIAAWQFSLMAACGVLSWKCVTPFIWIPAAVIQGFTVFNFTVMLHEVVHRTIFKGKHEHLYAALGWLYALPTGLSASQFTKWHLDHHAELGSDLADPKRHRLTPKRNARWLKLLYFTPALFAIYFRAAAQETATYEKPLRRKILRERTAAIALHVGFAAFALWTGGLAVLLRVYAIPVFLIFPVAFAVNRLGQHYAIDPEDVAAWSTRMRRSRLWEVVFLGSHYHLEHHDFPGVPFYNLRKLNALLSPFLERRGIPERRFGQILFLYLVRNKTPHTDWDLA